ncbi:MAG: multidrug effflux MFS transporter [Sinobacterium sp.]|nr:multidrug effflux MFS transporter [Sinobacterium sp.]
MSKNRANLIYILAAIIALGPLSVDLYLPAMPAMRSFFDTDIAYIQLTLSSYLLGFSVFHLVCGPLSDRFGRKPILAGGLILYIIMSILCAQATTIEELVIYRFIQAMGACCAPTLGRAIVRDHYDGQAAIKALAYVSSLMAIAPVIAPSLGGIIIKYADWTMTFYLLAGAGVIALLLTIFVVPESLPQKQPLHPAHIARNFKHLLTHKAFMAHVLIASFLYSCAFAFLSGISFILIDFMGVKAEHFGLYFLCIVSGYIGGNLFTGKIAHSWPIQKIYPISITIALIPSLAMVGFSLAQWYHPLLYVIPVLFNTMAIGLLLPRAMAEALKPFPHMAATASAMMGFLQMAIASIAGGLVGYFLVDNPLPMALVIAGGTIMALILFIYFRGDIRSHEEKIITPI